MMRQTLSWFRPPPVSKSLTTDTALLTVLVQWKEALGTGSAHTMREIIAAAVNRPDFHNALLTVAAARTGKVVSNERLGRWFKASEGKIVNALHIIREGMRDGYPMWRLNELG